MPDISGELHDIFQQQTDDIDIVITNKVPVDRGTLLAASSLALICVAATGTNNIDLASAEQCNITVCNVRAYATTSVVEHVFSLILSLNRRLHEYQSAVSRGEWNSADTFCLLDYPVRELAGQTLGIIGYGELGRAVAGMAEAFGMKVLIAQRPGSHNAPGAGRVSLDQLLAQADIISLHCPLSKDTANLIDHNELGKMRKGALLINTARGGIIEEAALVAALKRGNLGGAGFDVLTAEPPGMGNPLLDYDGTNLILTPHVAWAGREARQRLVDQVADIIEAFKRGELVNPV